MKPSKDRYTFSRIQTTKVRQVAIKTVLDGQFRDKDRDRCQKKKLHRWEGGRKGGQEGKERVGVIKLKKSTKTGTAGGT